MAATTLAATPHPSRALDRVALFISAVCAPPVLAVPIVLITSNRASDHSLAIGQALLLLVAIAVVPSIYVYREYRRGAVRTLELTSRSERRRPTTLTALCGVAAAVVLLLFDGPAPLRSLALAAALELCVLAVITPYWKISYHAAVAATLAAASTQLANPPLTLLCVALALIVGWARIHLGRHTPAQVAAGFAASLPVWIALAR